MGKSRLIRGCTRSTPCLHEKKGNEAGQHPNVTREGRFAVRPASRLKEYSIFLANLSDLQSYEFHGRMTCEYVRGRARRSTNVAPINIQKAA